VQLVDGDAETARVALNSLPPEQKQVIELAYFGGLSTARLSPRTLTTRSNQAPHAISEPSSAFETA